MDTKNLIVRTYSTARTFLWILLIIKLICVVNLFSLKYTAVQVFKIPYVALTKR